MSTLATVFGYGLLSARAAASVAGRFYYATDTSLMYRDNGSTWDTLSVGAGSMATDTLWDAAGDLAVGTGANTGHKLAAGASGTILKSAGAADPTWALAPAFHGARARHSTTQTIGSGVIGPMVCDTEDYDTDAFHFTSAAALTGTVAKTASSADIVGTDTSFTTELTVNQVISIPGTATEIGVVKTITDNTHITLWQTMANNASGQTATRRSEFMAVPLGFAGKYRIAGGFRWATVTTAKISYCMLGLNGTLTAFGSGLAANSMQSVTSSNNFLDAATTYALAEGDYVAVYMGNGESGTVTISGGVAYSPFLQLELAGN